MTDASFREIETGPTFEVHRGPTSMQRLDWSRTGAIRSITFGQPGAEVAEVIIKRMDSLLRLKPKVPYTFMYDMWAVTGYESGLRVEMSNWAQKHREDVAMIHFLSNSKLVNMAVSVVGLALPGLVTGHSKRADFDIVAKKFGLPLNPVMPTFTFSVG